MSESLPKNDSKTKMLNEALRYQTLGWSIVPLHWITMQGKCSCGNEQCPSPGKHPRIKTKEFQSRIATVDELKEWWGRWPKANIGLIPGEISRLIVLDVDEPKGVDTLREKKLAVPITVRSQTGSGGYHHFFQWPGYKCANHAGQIGHTILPNVDFRGDGGLVVLPPSNHISGRVYEWIKGPGEEEYKIAPAWLLNSIRMQGESHPDGNGKDKNKSRKKGHSLPKNPEGWESELLLGVEEGRRTDSCTKLAGKWLRESQGNKDQVYLMLCGWNQRNMPPLTEPEVRLIVDNIAARQGIDELGKGLGLDIDKIMFISSPDGEGRFEFYIKYLKKPVVFIPGDMCTFSRFRVRYLAVTGVYVNDLTKKEFTELIKKGVAEAEKIEISEDEANQTPIKDLILSHIKFPAKSLDEIDKSIVVDDQMIYLKISTLIKFQADSFEKFTRKEIGKLLRDIGFEYKHIWKDGKDYKIWVTDKKALDS